MKENKTIIKYRTDRSTLVIQRDADLLRKKTKEDSYGDIFRNQQIKDESDLFWDESELLLRESKWNSFFDSEDDKMKQVKISLSLVNHLLDENVKTDGGGMVDIDYLKDELMKSLLSCEAACNKYLFTHQNQSIRTVGVRRREQVERVMEGLMKLIADVSDLISDGRDGIEGYDSISVRDMLVDFKINGHR